jgi:hypothetical protein
MARNPKPLNILVADDLMYCKPIKALAEKGHILTTFSNASDLSQYDIIFSPQAWRLTPELASTAKLPDVAVTAARAQKYPRKGKDEAKDIRSIGDERSDI